MTQFRPLHPARTHVIALVLGVAAAGLTGTAVLRPTAVAAATAPPSIARPFTFTDTFDNGRTDGWSHLDEGRVGGPSKWAVVAGQLHQSSNVYGGSTSATDISKPGTDFIAGNAAWTNYDYTVHARTTDDDAFGLIFRYVDANNYYRFSMDKSRHYRRLVVKQNGHYRLLAHGTYGYVSNTSYTLRVIAIGSRIRVYVNGVQIYDVTDATLSHGKIGLYTWGNPTTFDSVAVHAQADWFSIAVVPDIQNETQFAPAMLAAQTQWLAANRAAQNLALVLQDGDLVNTMSDPAQWATVHTYLAYLGGKVPLAVAAGNHDLLNVGPGRYPPYALEPTAFNQTIGSLPDYSVTSSYGEAGDVRNTYKLFSAGGVDFVLLNLEFGAPDDVLAWAGVVADEYPNRHVILLTHDYLGQSNKLRGTEPTDEYLPHTLNPTLNDGVDMWQKFVDRHANVQFVFNGHVIAPTSPPDRWSTGRLESPDQAGTTVFQILANYQTLANGDGYLRVLHFYPSLGKIAVVTYSPYLQHRGQPAYLTDPDNQFTLDNVDFSQWPVPVTP